MRSLLVHAFGTPWTQLTLGDACLAVVVFLVFNLLVGLVEAPFRRCVSDEGD